MIIGWDISTAAIGVCVRRAGEPDLFRVIFPDGKTHAEKHRSAARQVTAFMWEVERSSDVIERDQKTHIVEQCLGGFTGGLTSKQTLMALASMNAVVSFVLGNDWGTVMHILPVTAKRITGLVVLPGETKKDAVVRSARSSAPNFPYRETKGGNPVKGTDDMADAWLLAEAGARLLSGEATIGQPKNQPKKIKPQRKKPRVS